MIWVAWGIAFAAIAWALAERHGRRLTEALAEDLKWKMQDMRIRHARQLQAEGAELDAAFEAELRDICDYLAETHPHLKGM